MIHGTWADGYGIWHAVADTEDEAIEAITDELNQRDAIGAGYEVEVIEYEKGKYREA